MKIEPTDIRDFRSTKRTRRDFERALHRYLLGGFAESALVFDHVFRVEVRTVVRRVAEILEVINVVGLRRDQDKIAPGLKTAFHLFHEAANLLAVSLQALRGGSEMGGLANARQALELAAVAFVVGTDPDREAEFNAGKLNATKCVGTAKKAVSIVGRLYGCLSEHHVHPSLLSVGRSLSSRDGDESRIIIGAAFEPERRQRFAHALLRVGQVAFTIHALAERPLFRMLERPTFWKAMGDPESIRWAPDDNRLKELGQLEDLLAPSEDPLAELPDDLATDRREAVAELVKELGLRSIVDLAELQGAVAKNPTRRLLRYLFAVALQVSGKLGEAEAEYSLLLSDNGESFDIPLRLAWLHSARGESEKAIARYEEHLTAAPTDAGSWNNLGLLLDAAGKFDAALTAYAKAQEHRVDYYKASYNAALALAHAGRLDEAITKYEEAARYDPSSADPWHSRGVALLKKGDAANAYRSFRRAISLDPGYFASWLNLGVCAYELGWVRKARGCYLRAIALVPDSYSAHYSYADICQLQKDSAEAEKHARAATEIDPGRADAWHVLGHALETLGNATAGAAALARWRELGGKGC